MYSGLPLSVVAIILLVIVFSPLLIFVMVEIGRAKLKKERLEWSKAFDRPKNLQYPSENEEVQLSSDTKTTPVSSTTFDYSSFPHRYSSYGRRKGKRKPYQPKRPGTSYVTPRLVHWSEKVDDSSVSLMDVQKEYVAEVLKNVHVDRIHGVPGFGLKDVFGESGEVGTKSEVRSAHRLDELVDEFPYVEVFHSVVLEPPYDIDHVIVMGWVIILVDDKKWQRDKKYVFTTDRKVDFKSELVIENDEAIVIDTKLVEVEVEDFIILPENEIPSVEPVVATVSNDTDEVTASLEPSVITVTRDDETFSGSHITVHRSERLLRRKFDGFRTNRFDGTRPRSLKGYTIYSIVSVDADSSAVLVNDTKGEIVVVHQYELMSMIRKLLKLNSTHFFGCRDLVYYCNDSQKFINPNI